MNMKNFTAGAALWLCCIHGGQAETYSGWIAAPESWRRGYVYAYADHVSLFARDEWSRGQVRGYQACLAGFSDQALVKVVDDFYLRNPQVKTEQLIIAVFKAFEELCAQHLPPRPAK